jgi:hypothetical protein
MARLDRTLVQLCARCGGWLSVSNTYAVIPYEVRDGYDGEPELIVLRLPALRDVSHYLGDRGCKCRVPPRPRADLHLEEQEWAERQREERIARGEAVIFP